MTIDEQSKYTLTFAEVSMAIKQWIEETTGDDLKGTFSISNFAPYGNLMSFVLSLLTK